MRCTTVKYILPAGLLAIGLLLPGGMVQALTVDCEDLTLASNSQWDGVDTTYDNGSGDSNPFNSRGATFNNFHEFSDPWGFGPTHYWDGWAYSNRNDTASTGMAGQYTAVGSGTSGQNGAGNSANYAVGYLGYYSRVPAVTFGQASAVAGAYFTNNAYAYHSMREGDSFTEKFGGATGNDPDWFLLTITGKDAGGAVVGTEEFYLADYRYADNGSDYIVDDWTWADLSALGAVSSLEFSLTSSDVGSYGMNTPAYFAMDNIQVLDGAPEPASMAIMLIAASLLLCGTRRCGRTA